MFKVMYNKGFHITFPNGVTLSTQIGFCNYCDNYDGHIRNTEDLDDFQYQRKFGSISSTAEIAIWTDKSEKWITEECPFCEKDSSVTGYVDINKWLDIVEWCKSYVVKEDSEL